jgi:hypothetical protein
MKSNNEIVLNVGAQYLAPADHPSIFGRIYHRRKILRPTVITLPFTFYFLPFTFHKILPLSRYLKTTN